ncbi:MAG: 1-(5-phosphoribosyl)-5-((5-phosphoribosylamino)methylideneamino)imidazole-4-carboxamide isomerase, partial [Planctomycetes bacterium]|nr:1-(5-phosphoribosyl)-5-((5-phosphoribosylamino)methylideneamino)imidazole-4-carboxamide isomerase [Planctomycetota bacterium]
NSVDINVVASGGVCTAADIKKLVELGSIAAAIVGRAIYEGTITVEQAIEAAEA